MKTSVSLPVLLTMMLATWLTVGWTGCAGERPGPDALRARADRLEEKARDLKAAGRHDDAQRAMTEAQELRAQADRRQGGGPGPEDRARLEQEREELLKRLDQLRAEGRQDEAAGVKERILGLERQLKGAAPKPVLPAEADRGMRPQREPREGAPDRREARDAAQRRLEHLRIAVEHLHAAGMHEPAERLNRELERYREQMERERREPTRPGPELAAEVERLRAELQEMRRNLQEMREHMERMNAERR